MKPQDLEKWNRLQERSRKEYIERQKNGKKKPKKEKKRRMSLEDYTVAALKNEVLWPLFSLHVRVKDADDRGYNSCITCGVVKHYKDLQAGHFIPGRHNAILFDERGCHPQCYHCNVGLKSNPRRYDRYMRENYGDAVIKELEVLDDTNKQFTKPEIISMIEHYREILSGYEALRSSRL